MTIAGEREEPEADVLLLLLLFKKYDFDIHVYMLYIYMSYQYIIFIIHVMYFFANFLYLRNTFSILHRINYKYLVWHHMIYSQVLPS